MQRRRRRGRRRRDLVAEAVAVDAAAVGRRDDAVVVGGIRAQREDTHRGQPLAEHLEALRTHDTVVTDAYTGRPMRAARNDVLEQLMQRTPLPFPY